MEGGASASQRQRLHAQVQKRMARHHRTEQVCGGVGVGVGTGAAGGGGGGRRSRRSGGEEETGVGEAGELQSLHGVSFFFFQEEDQERFQAVLEGLGAVRNSLCGWGLACVCVCVCV